MLSTVHSSIVAWYLRWYHGSRPPSGGDVRDYELLLHQWQRRKFAQVSVHVPRLFERVACVLACEPALGSGLAFVARPRSLRILQPAQIFVPRTADWALLVAVRCHRRCLLSHWHSPLYLQATYDGVANLSNSIAWHAGNSNLYVSPSASER